MLERELWRERFFLLLETNNPMPARPASVTILLSEAERVQPWVRCLIRKNKVKDKATAVKENIKDMPTQTAYALHSAKEKAKENVSDFKRGIVQGQETRQSQRADKLQQHRQNIADKRMELQKAQEAKQAGRTTDGSATTGATRPP